MSFSLSRDDWIRTSGLFVPNEARYRAALHPEVLGERGRNLHLVRQKTRFAGR